jgi:hypothetical protein
MVQMGELAIVMVAAHRPRAEARMEDGQDAPLLDEAEAEELERDRSLLIGAIEALSELAEIPPERDLLSLAQRKMPSAPRDIAAFLRKPPASVYEGEGEERT